jgi:predicted secreted protein
MGRRTQDPAEQGACVELTEPDAGSEHSIGVGQELIVRLQENRTTGYQWQLTIPPDGLALDDDAYEAATDRPGSGGIRTFRLHATGPGTHRLGAALRRSWESGEGRNPALEFVVTAR